MVAQPGIYQASCNSGELMPELHGRTDIKQYYAGLSYGLNVEPVPQAGGRLSPRSRHRGRIRHMLDAIANGSTSYETDPVSVAGQIARVDFSAGATAISALRLDGFGATLALDAIIQAQALVGGNWTDFGDAFGIDGTAIDARSRMVALAPGDAVTATAMRLILTDDPASAVTFTIGGLVGLSETTTLSPFIIRTFDFSLTQTYAAVFTDGHCDFWRNGAWVGAIATGVDGAKLSTLDAVQRFDTMLLYHPQLKSQRLFRAGADNQWVRDDEPVGNIPQVDLGGTYDNAVTDEWKVYINYPTSGTYGNGAGLLVSIKVDEEETAGIDTGAPNWTQFASDMQAAINALPSIGGGATVSETHSTGLTVLTIAFGGDNDGQSFELTAQVVNTGTAAATVAHTQIGVPGGEPLISASRGYPACGAFYQQRLNRAGFYSKKSAFLCSVSGEYFDLNIDVKASTGAILQDIDTDGAEEIQKMARARHLLIFTSAGEYFISDRVFDRTQPLNVVNSSRNGSAQGVPIIESEDAILYFTPDRSSDNRSGVLLYSMTYDDVNQAYVSEPLSLLAAHIVRDVVDAALQKSSNDTSANRLWAVRSDGTMTEGAMIRNQDVTAFTRWQTAGAVGAVCVDGRGMPYIGVTRETAGEDETYLETLEEGLIFDATIEQTFDAPTMNVGNLDVHEGAEVWARADGYVVGPFTVDGGAIALPFEASTVEVGRWTAPSAKLLPLPRDIAQRTVLKRPARVHTVKVDVLDTTSIAVGANDRPARDCPLYRAGDAVDAPLAPYSGRVDVTGIKGFSKEGIVEITQVKPGALQWRGITVEART